MKRKLDELQQSDGNTTSSSTASISGISKIKHEEVESSRSTVISANSLVVAATPASDFLAAATAAATVGFDDDDWSTSDVDSDCSYDSEDDDIDIDAVWRNVGMGMTMVPKRVWSNPEISKLLCAKQKVETSLEERMRKSASAVFPSPMLPSKRSKASASQQQETSIQRPEDCLIGHLKKQGLTLDMVSSKMESFLTLSDQDLTAYPEVAYAARRGDLDTLKARLKNGLPLQCTNSYGESIVHIVCRRGSKVMLEFLMNDAKVSVRLKDDVGRTPLHDAVWTAEPNFDLVNVLLADSPDLLLVRDKRGHSALSYIPRTNWNRWCSFIDNHQELIQAALRSPHVIIDNKDEDVGVETKGAMEEEGVGGIGAKVQSIVG